MTWSDELPTGEIGFERIANREFDGRANGT
jgi:hypothetical protein